MARLRTWCIPSWARQSCRPAAFAVGFTCSTNSTPMIHRSRRAAGRDAGDAGGHRLRERDALQRRAATRERVAVGNRGAQAGGRGTRPAAGPRASARAEAEQANRTKDEFLATLSHELRTPLSAILGWSHLVRTGKLDEPQLSRAFETIERNARSQSQLIDDLLDVSRIITGKLQIEPRLGRYLCGDRRRRSKRCVRRLKQRIIQFETVLDAEACLVRGDANRLQQIFWNLFSNADQVYAAGWRHPGRGQAGRRASASFGERFRHRHHAGVSALHFRSLPAG